MYTTRAFLVGAVLLSLAASSAAKDDLPPGSFGVDYLSGHAGVKHFSAVLAIDDQQIRVTDGHKPPKEFTVPLASITQVRHAVRDYQEFVTITAGTEALVFRVREHEAARIDAQVSAAAQLPPPAATFGVDFFLSRDEADLFELHNRGQDADRQVFAGILSIDREALRLIGGDKKHEGKTAFLIPVTSITDVTTSTRSEEDNGTEIALGNLGRALGSRQRVASPEYSDAEYVTVTSETEAGAAAHVFRVRPRESADIVAKTGEVTPCPSSPSPRTFV
jgi:hypothetical protein